MTGGGTEQPPQAQLSGTRAERSSSTPITGSGTIRGMATQPQPERDPVDEEIERVLDDNPGLLERLREYDRQRELGVLDLVPHEEALRQLGLDRPAR